MPGRPDRQYSAPPRLAATARFQQLIRMLRHHLKVRRPDASPASLSRICKPARSLPACLFFLICHSDTGEHSSPPALEQPTSGQNQAGRWAQGPTATMLSAAVDVPSTHAPAELREHARSIASPAVAGSFSFPAAAQASSPAALRRGGRGPLGRAKPASIPDEEVCVSVGSALWRTPPPPENSSCEVHVPNSIKALKFCDFVLAGLLCRRI